MTNGKMTVKRVMITLSLLFAAWLPLVGYGRFVESHAAGYPASPPWVSTKELLHLTRYHGTDALKITQDKVYIWRNGRWLPVLKRDRG